MFCGNCGKQIDDSSEFCAYCGAMVEHDDVVVKSENKYAKIFIEPDENYIASLGDSYLNSILANKNIKQCIAFLSDKRIYLRGNMIDINSGKLERFNIQKTIDLEDITGTGFIYASPQVWKLVLAIILPIIGLFFYFFGVIPGGIASILLIVSYMKNRETLFFIEYAGGCIKFDASIYGLTESQDFEKQIRRAKNRVKGKK